MTGQVPAAVIHYRLALVLKLFDSVSGRQIEDRKVSFSFSNGMASPVSKEPGTYLFLNSPRENFEMQILIHGFEPKRFTVNFDEINEQLPILDVFMIPLDISTSAISYLTISGRLENISGIECISTREPICNVKDFNSRKRELNLYNPQNYTLSQVHYGLLDNSCRFYDKIEITEEISRSKLILKYAPEHGCTTNQQIMRIVHGQIQQDGTYLLKVFENTNAEYLVRFVVNEKVYFQKMDFHQPEELSILEQKDAPEEKD